MALHVRVKSRLETLAPRSFGHPDDVLLELRMPSYSRCDCRLDK